MHTLFSILQLSQETETQLKLILNMSQIKEFWNVSTEQLTASLKRIVWAFGVSVVLQMFKLDFLFCSMFIGSWSICELHAWRDIGSGVKMCLWLNWSIMGLNVRNSPADMLWKKNTEIQL